MFLFGMWGKIKFVSQWIFVEIPKSILMAIRQVFINICWTMLKSFEHPIQTKSSKLPDLCPTDNAKYVDSYIDMLNEALINREKTVKEIAVTSPYSGGKSSFLNTFKRKTPFLSVPK